VLASLDVLRDTRIFWPPRALWGALRSPQRLESGGGLALVVVRLAASVLQGQDSIGALLAQRTYMAVIAAPGWFALVLEYYLTVSLSLANGKTLVAGIQRFKEWPFQTSC
jgi:hypothetical protein